MWSFERKKMQMVTAADALPGRDTALVVTGDHLIFKRPLQGPYPNEMARIIVGMGCFWGVERLFWQQPGVYLTAVGYSAGFTPNPTYEEVCTGLTGHNEVVLIVYQPEILPFENVVKLFWENHNPTTGMQQANDIGTQYRSGIYTFTDDQFQQALDSRQYYQEKLGFQKNISTEIIPAGAFYFAETYHQQYLAKNPGGYCNMQSYKKTGFPCFSED